VVSGTRREVVPRGTDARWLVLNNPARLDPTTHRHDDYRLCVIDTCCEFLGREATEHDRVDSADSRTRGHRHIRFRDHRHADDDGVALRDPEIGKRTRDLRNLVMQRAEGGIRFVSATGES
jgi:hypothetical protein